MTIQKQFKILLKAQGVSEVSKELIETLFLRAKSDFLAICNRSDIPKEAHPIIAEMMLIHYNRIGAEGEHQRREGDVSYTLQSQVTGDMASKLRAFNLGRVI